MKWVVEASWYSLRRGFDFVRPRLPRHRLYHHYLRRWRCVPTHPRNSSSFLVTASVRPRGDPPSSSSRAAVIFPSHHRTSAHSSSFHSIELFPNFTRSQPITPSSWHQPTYSQTKKVTSPPFHQRYRHPLAPLSQTQHTTHYSHIPSLSTNDHKQDVSPIASALRLQRVDSQVSHLLSPLALTVAYPLGGRCHDNELTHPLPSPATNAMEPTDVNFRDNRTTHSLTMPRFIVPCQVPGSAACKAGQGRSVKFQNPTTECAGMYPPSPFSSRALITAAAAAAAAAVAAMGWNSRRWT